MPKALVLGEMCVDVILVDPESVPVCNTSIWARDAVIRLGGSATYTAQGLKALDVDVSIHSFVGEDSLTNHLLDELKAQSIGLENVRVLADLSTPTCLCTVAAGKKKFIGCSHFPNYPLDLLDVPLQDEQLVYFGGYLMYPELWEGSLANFFARAKDQALIVVDTQFLPIPVDLYRHQAMTTDNLKDVDILLVNRSESLALTACKRPMDASKYLADLGPKTIVTKLGNQGCLVWSNNEFFESQPFIGAANDPLGAGDLFGAAFSYGRLQNWDLQTTSDFANAFAALSISRARKELPDLQATQAFMNTQTIAART